MKTTLGVATLALSLLATSALAAPHVLSDAQLGQVVAGDSFTVTGEVSDQFTESGNPADPLLVNSWGLSQGQGTFLWVANNGTGTSTLYDPSNGFGKVALNVTIPAGGGGDQSAPTGTVFTSLSGASFPVTQNGVTGHSIFLFDTEDGAISGWAPSVNFTNAVIAVDDSEQGAVFKGLTLTQLGGGSIYAADFANNRVDMFNSQFQQTGSFTDASLPAGYAPFNVQALQGVVYVAFALQADPAHPHDEAHGAGLGFIDIFDRQGHKLETLVANGPLNAPWGMVIAPPNFGKFAGDLLVGNFGDGKINAFNPITGAFIGALTGADGETPLSIDGLWALRTGPDGSVIFSSGPNEESHGLVGVIKPGAPSATASAASWAMQAHVSLVRH